MKVIAFRDCKPIGIYLNPLMVCTARREEGLNIVEMADGGVWMVDFESYKRIIRWINKLRPSDEWWSERDLHKPHRGNQL